MSEVEQNANNQSYEEKKDDDSQQSYDQNGSNDGSEVGDQYDDKGTEQAGEIINRSDGESGNEQEDEDGNQQFGEDAYDGEPNHDHDEFGEHFVVFEDFDYQRFEQTSKYVEEVLTKTMETYKYIFEVQVPRIETYHDSMECFESLFKSEKQKLKEFVKKCQELEQFLIKNDTYFEELEEQDEQFKELLESLKSLYEKLNNYNVPFECLEPAQTETANTDFIDASDLTLTRQPQNAIVVDGIAPVVNNDPKEEDDATLQDSVFGFLSKLAPFKVPEIPELVTLNLVQNNMIGHTNDEISVIDLDDSADEAADDIPMEEPTEECPISNGNESTRNVGSVQELDGQYESWGMPSDSPKKLKDLTNLLHS